MKGPCEYCNAELPPGLTKNERRVRSAHFQLHVNERSVAAAPPAREEWLEAFIKRAGFTHGWRNLESWARRMAEQAYEERSK